MEDVRAFLVDLHRAECEGLLSCAVDAGFVDLAQCLAEAAPWSGVASQLPAAPDELLMLADMGRLGLDPALAIECLATLRGECTADTRRYLSPTLLPLPEACRAMFQTPCAASAGGACTDHIACSPTEYCAASREGWCAASATCAPRRRVGESCRESVECVAETVCSAGTCRRVTREVVADGAPCGIVDATADEVTAMVCGEGARCVGEPDRTCVRASRRGEACSGVCAVGEVCNEGICMARTRIRAGEPCSLDCELASFGYACVAGTCEQSDGLLDAPCSRPGSCWWGLECDLGRCALPALRAPGEACARDIECASHCCVGDLERACQDVP